MTEFSPSNSKWRKPVIWYSIATSLLVVIAGIIYMCADFRNSSLPANSAGKDSTVINPEKKTDISSSFQKRNSNSNRNQNKSKVKDGESIIPEVIAENMQAPAGMVTDVNQKDDAVISFIATSPPPHQPETANSEEQEGETEVDDIEKDLPILVEPILSVEERATFQGGDLLNFQKYVLENFKINESVQNYGNSGKVVAQFYVGLTGHIEEIKILKGLNYAADNEMIRVLKNSPPWKPAKQKGKVIRQRFILPLSIDLREEP